MLMLHLKTHKPQDLRDSQRHRNLAEKQEQLSSLKGAQFNYETSQGKGKLAAYGNER